MSRLVRVSFDYDDTIANNREIEDYARDLIYRGFDVWIITSRQPKHGAEVIKQAKKLKIDPRHVIFTDLEYKYDVIAKVAPVFHLDDSWIETTLIKKRTGTEAINHKEEEQWKTHAEQSLNPYKDRQGLSIRPSAKLMIK